MPNIPPKLQTKIPQGEFIDFAKLLQAEFYFKYASVGPQDIYKMVSQNGSFVIKPKWKGKQIDGLM